MKIGVWGLGSIGLRHAKNAMAMGHVVTGFDPDQARQNLLQQAGGDICETEEALLQKNDAIIICSPNALHFDHLKQAIQNDCHVLIEKPLAHKIEGFDKIFAEAKKRDLVIAPAMNMRFDGVVQKTKELMQSQKLGQILWARFTCSAYLPDWRPHQDYKKGYTNDPKTGGVIFDIIHEFDMAYYLLGDMDVTASVATHSGSIGLESEDCADIILKTKKGNAPVTIHLDYISKYNQRFFDIQGDDYFLKADLNDRTIRIYNKDGLVSEEDITQSDIACYEEEMMNFLDAIQGEKEYICSLEEALAVLKIVIEARDKAGLPS